MYLQSKVVQLSYRYIPKFDAMIPETKEENIKITSSQKRKFKTSAPLQNALRAQQVHLSL